METAHLCQFVLYCGDKHDHNSLGGKKIYLVYSFRSKIHPWGSQGRNSGRSWSRNQAGELLVDFLLHFFSYISGPSAQQWHYPQEAGPPTTMSKQANALQANLMKAALQPHHEYLRQFWTVSGFSWSQLEEFYPVSFSPKYCTVILMKMIGLWATVRAKSSLQNDYIMGNILPKWDHCNRRVFSPVSYY